MKSLKMIGLALAALAIAGAASAEIGRDDQWVDLPHAKGGPAVEFRYVGRDPSSVMWRVACPVRGRLSFEYFYDMDPASILPRYRQAPLELTLYGFVSIMPSREGRRSRRSALKLAPALVDRIETAHEILLFGPSELEEAMYAGAARPFRRLARRCMTR